MDFDTQYRDEEETLRGVSEPGMWQPRGRHQSMLVAPREPGQGDLFLVDFSFNVFY